MLAAKRGFVALAELLIDAAPNCVRAIDKTGDSALTIAAHNGQLEIVRLLLSERVPTFSLSNGELRRPSRWPRHKVTWKLCGF